MERTRRKPGPKPRPITERFWEKVYKTPECWLWTAGRFKNGYGSITVDGRSVAAHRLAWELERGEIPEGQMICHTCDTPACVNPAHMFLGGQSDNMADKATKGRTRLAKLTPADDREIRRQRDSADAPSLSELGERFGVSRQCIANVLRGETWRHVE